MYLASASSRVTAIFVHKCIRVYSKNDNIYIIYKYPKRGLENDKYRLTV